MRFERNAKVGKVDRYEAKIDANWLGTETITSCPVTASNTNVTIGTVTIVGSDIFFMVTGVAVGTVELTFDVVTSGGRTDCKHATLGVELC
jgi:hypothetical protein